MARCMCFRKIVNIGKLRLTLGDLNYFSKDKLYGGHYSNGKSNSNCSIKFAHQYRFISISSRLYNVSEEQLKRRIDDLGEKFTEARELMDDARESEGTVYFSADLEDAQKAVTETLSEYNKLLESVSETQKESVVRTIGLRMGELKAQLDAINESLKD